MKKKNVLISGLCFVLAVFIGSAGIAQEALQMDPEMMEAYMKMMAPNKNHEFLKNFVGEWDVTTTAWMQPGAEPVTAQNRAKAELIFGGRFLKIDFKGSMFGQPFDGIQIIGYDNFQKKYVSFWIDSSSTAFYLTKGSRDEGKKRIIETGLWPDPMGGEDMKVRTVTTLVSKDEYAFEMIMILPDGTEFKSMENRSKRKMDSSLLWQESIAPDIRNAPCSTVFSSITLTSSWLNMSPVSRESTASDLSPMPGRNAYHYLPLRLCRSGQDHPTSQVDLRGREASSASCGLSGNSGGRRGRRQIFFMIFSLTRPKSG